MARTIDLQPTLRGESTSLRPLRAEDWEPMFAAGSDPMIWEVHPERERYREALFRDFFDSGLQSRAALTIVDNATATIIGSSRYHGHDPELREIEIGWTFLARPFWGGIYNREIKRMMVDHVFQFVDTVIFYVGEENWRSQRAMQKIGAKRRDEIRLRSYSWGECRHVIFEIRKDSWRLDGIERPI